LGRVPPGEIVADEQLCDGELAGVVEDLGHRHRSEPVGVVDHLATVIVENAHHLVEVVARVLDHLFRALRRTGRGAARRVADLAGEPADNQHRGVTEVLELAQLAQDDRVPERQTGSGGIDPQLHPQWALLLPRREQPLGEPVDRKDLRGSGGEHLVRLAEVRG
jgi:hypothetical protein